ncbi:MAG: OB-fold nucleic acid binding domain-containing protein [Bryobacteraceae bacterium]
MKSPYVSELQPNQIITALFLVRNKDIRQKKTGEPYLSLTLSDRSGELDAKMWDNAAEVLDSFERDDFLRIRGLMQVHQNRLQLTIHKLQQVPSNQIDGSDFFPASERDVQQMWTELRSIIDSLSNSHLQQLLALTFDDSDIAERFRVAPAARPYTMRSSADCLSTYSPCAALPACLPDITKTSIWICFWLESSFMTSERYMS